MMQMKKIKERKNRYYIKNPISSKVKSEVLKKKIKKK